MPNVPQPHSAGGWLTVLRAVRHEAQDPSGVHRGDFAGLDNAWMAQIARNLTDAKDGFLKDVRHLIVDRDPLYTEQFKTILASSAVELLKLPPSSPNLNAFAERWVRSIKEECLDRVVPLGERHLRHVISEYVEHFHTERNHQGLANVIPFPETTPGNDRVAIERRERFGGLLSHYRRKAA